MTEDVSIQASCNSLSHCTDMWSKHDWEAPSADELSDFVEQNSLGALASLSKGISVGRHQKSLLKKRSKGTGFLLRAVLDGRASQVQVHVCTKQDGAEQSSGLFTLKPPYNSGGSLLCGSVESGSPDGAGERATAILYEARFLLSAAGLLQVMAFICACGIRHDMPCLKSDAGLQGLHVSGSSYCAESSVGQGRVVTSVEGVPQF